MRTGHRDATITRALRWRSGTAAQFARVASTTPDANITASGGLSIVNETFTGAVRIAFPVSMDNCAVTATAFTGGATTSVRRSSGAGTEIVVVGFDGAGATVETDFDVIAQCCCDRHRSSGPGPTRPGPDAGRPAQELR